MHRTSRALARQFLIGLLTGMVSGVVGIVIGLLGVLLALVVTIAVGIGDRTLGRIAGGLIGVGVIWLLLTGQTIQACSATDDFCGHANVVPLLGFSSAIVAVGCIFGLTAWWRNGAQRGE